MQGVSQRGFGSRVQGVGCRVNHWAEMRIGSSYLWLMTFVSPNSRLDRFKEEEEERERERKGAIEGKEVAERLDQRESECERERDRGRVRDRERERERETC